MTGYDFSAALAMGGALGVCPRALAELLPIIEGEMVTAAAAKAEASRSS